MSIDRNSFELGSLYKITTASGEVSGVVIEAGPDAVSVGQGPTVVQYKDIRGLQKIQPQVKSGTNGFEMFR
ncbi:hypothetical protein ACTJK3_03955 [Pseudomonas sp. 22105]|jgi:hypothetical protein|uniref:hypothetical protein n=1 Tax=Pseudomonas TaxID=286 RepID=UPI000D25B1D1|nr:hypothetical protein [Pseudomonas glycinae]AWA39819.1 hypothetical protein DBV33_14920 [Pseudomonas fluorescens]